MEKDNIYTMDELIEAAAKEFDETNPEHVFSNKYKKQKKEILQAYRKRQYVKTYKRYALTAAAALAVLVGTPIAVNAATNGELFNRIWGNEGKANVASHQEKIYEEEKDSSYVVTYPERDYVKTDEETGNKLIGDKVSYVNREVDLDGTKLTIQSVVRDENTAVVEFTMENPDGIDKVMNYSQLDNEAKGAMVSDDATFSFLFQNTGGSIYVDLERSTEQTLYCYDYLTFDEDMDQLQLETCIYPCKRSELYYEGMTQEQMDEIAANTKESVITIDLPQALETETFTCDGNGSIEISPIGMKLDCANGLGLSGAEANDPGNIYFIRITYQNGEEYIVWDRESERNNHHPETEIDNSSYACGYEDGLKVDFNRLVDMEQVASITVNTTTYAR